MVFITRIQVLGCLYFIFCGLIMGGYMCVTGSKRRGTDDSYLLFLFYIIFESNKHCVSVKPSLLLVNI